MNSLRKIVSAFARQQHPAKWKYCNRLVIYTLPGCQYSDLPTPKTSQSGESGSKKKSWGKKEFTATLTIGAAFISWGCKIIYEYRDEKRKMQMGLITRQLDKLYGPLYGNRKVAKEGYDAVMKDYDGLRNYLEMAKMKKDKDMIKNWRSFVQNVLYPLDEEAKKIICKYAHLAEDDNKVQAEFDKFLQHTAKFRFLMEQWENEKCPPKSDVENSDVYFSREANATGIKEVKLMIKHLKKKCKHLRSQRQRLVKNMGVNVDIPTSEDQD